MSRVEVEVEVEVDVSRAEVECFVVLHTVLHIESKRMGLAGQSID